MTDYTNYFAWLADGGWIRVSVRTLIFNPAHDRILVEQNIGVGNDWVNFIGGGVETGETMRAAIARELREETNADIARADYRFVVENFFPHQGEIRHSLEHYFEVTLDREDVVPKNDGIVFTWLPLARLATADLRPSVVRDAIATNRYRTISHMIIGDGAR